MFHTNYFFKTVMNVLDKMLEYIFIFQKCLMVKDQRIVVFNTTFNNISVISWGAVLLMEETGENHDLPQVTEKLYHIMLHWVHLPWARFELTLVVIGTDCIGRYKSNYHTINTMTALVKDRRNIDIYIIRVHFDTFSIRFWSKKQSKN